MATKIYIDAGHGGKDPGAIGIGNAHEADINLIVAKHLQTDLIRNGFEVKMSRTTDVYKSLSQRCSEANTWGADIVVSIHCNSFKDATANGTETYIYAKGRESEKIAEKVNPNLVSVLKTKNRGVKEGNLAMVRDTKAPAILCELAFVSNKDDCAKLVNSAYQKNCAVAICKGICSYKKITYKTEETKVATTSKKDYSGRWSEQAIDKMIEKKIMVGDGNGNFRPTEYVTREELAQTIYNLLSHL